MTTQKEYTPEELSRRTIARRAVEAVLWGMPLVNFDLMAQAALRAGARWNQIVHWSRLSDWRNQTLTPNPDAIYLMPFIDTTEAGPVVLEIPPADTGSITGSIMDSWQAALEDVGPAGVDKGKGGKYVILPPGYAGEVPDGMIGLQSDTFKGYALLRSILASGSPADVAKAVAYGRRIRLYPLWQDRNPPRTTFVDVADGLFDATIPYDLRYFQSLDHLVQSEPWLARDKAMIDPLKSIGIRKGRAFDPDDATKALLEEAVAEAHAWIDDRYAAAFTPPWVAGARWAVPAPPDLVEGQQTFFARPDSYPVDARSVMFSMAFFSAKHLGAGQFYLMTMADRAGRELDGARTYRLVVPPRAPVRQYWSATVYDRATHALIRDLPWPSRSSQTPGLQKNADGSVAVWFGPKSPPGQDTNWVPTRAGGRFEVLFRLYGPEKALFDKTWTLPDIEEVA